MNLTDLRDVLDERSSPDHAEARSHTLLDEVYHRLDVRRRRRRAAAVTTTGIGLAAVGIAAVVITPPSWGTPTAGPTTASPPAVRLVGGFAEYAHGAKVIAAASARTPARSVSVTFVPTSLDLGIFTRCEGTGDYSITINGRDFGSGTGCGLAYLTSDRPLGAEYGVTPGQPSTATFTAPDGGVTSLAVAVGQKTDPSRYVFPPRPATLIPLAHPADTSISAYGEHDAISRQSMSADPADPDAVRTLTVTWESSMRLTARSQTPGALSVRVDGVEVLTGEWWDYQQAEVESEPSGSWTSLYGLDPVRGRQVTVTVTPQRMTGDWAVQVETSN